MGEDSALHLLRLQVLPDEDADSAMSSVLVERGKYQGALARHRSRNAMKNVDRIYVHGAEQLDPDLMERVESRRGDAGLLRALRQGVHP